MLFLIVATLILTASGQILIPDPTPAAGPPPNCNIIVNSPQFAWLCRIPELVDTPLNEINLAPSVIQGLANVPASTLNLTANQICDVDCRCVMGATARGGRCGTPTGGSKAYCVCDYDQTIPRAPLNPVPCTNSGGQYITDLCPGVPLVGNGFLSNACNHDCQCSHGYGNTGQHLCSKQNNDPTNTMTYCVCGNGNNL